MILSNDSLVAFHYRSYGTFFLHKNRLHNIYRGFTHYKYYRAKVTSTCLIEVEVSLKRIFMVELSMRRVIFSKKFSKRNRICLTFV